MVVVAIMGIVMTISVPSFTRILRQGPLRKAANDVCEVCKNARAQAIQRSTMTEVIFHPQDGRFEVVGAAAPAPVTNESAPPAHIEAPAPAGSGLSGQIPGNVAIEMLDVNLMEFKDLEAAHVRFYPSGRCDELTLILRAADSRSGGDQVRIITTELTTGLVFIDTDPSKLLSLRR